MLKLDTGAEIYLSGPMTNMPEHNVHAFRKAACRVKAFGFKPISPHELNEKKGLPPNLPWFRYMRSDIPEIASSDGIYLLHGWHRSPGAIIELIVAIACARTIFFEQ